MATAATPPAPAPAPEETIVGIAATAAVHLCGELTPEAAETAATSGAYKSWLYLNPQCSADECGVGSAAAAAGLEFACLEVNKDALTPELAQRAVEVLDALPKPCLVQCSTATRAGAVLLLSLSKARNLNFEGAMQLAVDMNLNFAEGFVDQESGNALVRWVAAALSGSEIQSASPSLLVRQLFDPTSSTYTYLLADTATKDAVLIDPVDDHVARDLTVVEEAGLALRYVINTHAHADHITGSGLIKQQLPEVQSAIAAASGAAADVQIADGHELVFGTQRLTALSTPGHTLGCLSYHHAEGEIVFTGDALLIRGCGRTDFQGGSAETLFESVRNRLFTLPPNTTVAPAHDYKGRNVSRIADEMAYNPRLGGMQTAAAFVELMANLNLPYPKKIDVAVPANMRCGV